MYLNRMCVRNILFPIIIALVPGIDQFIHITFRGNLVLRVHVTLDVLDCCWYTPQLGLDLMATDGRKRKKIFDLIDGRMNRQDKGRDS